MMRFQIYLSTWCPVMSGHQFSTVTLSLFGVLKQSTHKARTFSSSPVALVTRASGGCLRFVRTRVQPHVCILKGCNLPKRSRHPKPGLHQPERPLLLGEKSGANLTSGLIIDMHTHSIVIMYSGGYYENCWYSCSMYVQPAGYLALSAIHVK